jgi:hypothetical protein
MRSGLKARGPKALGALVALLMSATASAESGNPSTDVAAANPEPAWQCICSAVECWENEETQQSVCRCAAQTCIDVPAPRRPG